MSYNSNLVKPKFTANPCHEGVGSNIENLLGKLHHTRFFSGLTIYKVNSSHKSIVLGNDKWQCLWDIIEPKLKKVTNDPSHKHLLEALCYVEAVRSEPRYQAVFKLFNSYKKNSLESAFKANSPYVKFMGEFAHTLHLAKEVINEQDTDISPTDIGEKCEEFIKATEIAIKNGFDLKSVKLSPVWEKTLKKVQLEFSRFEAKYPCLLAMGNNFVAHRDSNNFTKADIVHYIQLCDKAPTFITNQRKGN